MILDPGEVLYSLKNLSNGFPHVSPKGRTISINMQILFDRSNEWQKKTLAYLIKQGRK